MNTIAFLDEKQALGADGKLKDAVVNEIGKDRSESVEACSL